MSSEETPYQLLKVHNTEEKKMKVTGVLRQSFS